MKRRQFIWDTTQSLTLFMLSPSLLTCCNQDDESIVPNGKTAIVIGAGISGLAAAQSLQQAGFTVTVLEAQDKAGGRIRTNRSLGIAFDEGASWIHGPKRNPISDLATEAGDPRSLPMTIVLSYSIAMARPIPIVPCHEPKTISTMLSKPF